MAGGKIAMRHNTFGGAVTEPSRRRRKFWRSTWRKLISSLPGGSTCKSEFQQQHVANKKRDRN
jgi:hypothetical protein